MRTNAKARCPGTIALLHQGNAEPSEGKFSCRPPPLPARLIGTNSDIAAPSLRGYHQLRTAVEILCNHVNMNDRAWPPPFHSAT
jgi:hypothetical protein